MRRRRSRVSSRLASDSAAAAAAAAAAAGGHVEQASARLRQDGADECSGAEAGAATRDGEGKEDGNERRGERERKRLAYITKRANSLPNACSKSASNHCRHGTASPYCIHSPPENPDPSSSLAFILLISFSGRKLLTHTLSLFLVTRSPNTCLPFDRMASLFLHLDTLPRSVSLTRSSLLLPPPSSLCSSR